MSKLKDRSRQIPNGLYFVQPEIQWDSRKVLAQGPPFNLLVGTVRNMRAANRWHAQKYGWATDAYSIAEEVDAFNAKVCADHGWFDWINLSAGPPLPKFSPPRSGLSAVAGAAQKAWQGVKNVAAGIGVLHDWLGAGGRTVLPWVAEGRAKVCVICPKNLPGDWKAIFTQPVADKIKSQIEIKNSLELKTPLDDQLKHCHACDCVLTLKVWAPLKHIRERMSEETKSALDSRCWILKDE